MAAVYLGLGSNIGNRTANLRMALRALTRMSRVLAVSSLYETSPEGPPQPAFYNAACRIETGLEPRALLRFLQGIEHEIGRRPGPRWGPRPIDLDILLYEDLVLEEETLVIPHPRLPERAFALAPMAEIAPDVRVPASAQSLRELAAQAGVDGVKRIVEQGWDGVAGSDAGPVRL
jgi:GTP cyclohydrolase-4